MFFLTMTFFLAALLLPFAVWIAGLWFLALRSLFPRPRPPETSAAPFISIIVPAHDEQDVIDATVRHILACDYPRDRRALYVVADNCSDATGKLAQAAGATVLERSDAVNKGKGYALAYALEEIRKRSEGTGDAVLFLDADSSPETDYLRVMARYLARGDRMIQGRYEVLEPDRNWFTRLTSVSFVLRNRWQFPALDALGLTLPLRGSGMCFAAPVIHELGWSAHGLTEDTEMTLRLIRAGVRVTFAPDAVSRQFMPATPAEALTQRLRWSAGERGVRAVLLKEEIPWAFKARRLRAFLSLVLMAAPSFSLQMCAALLLTALSGLFATGLVWLWLAVLLAFAGYFLLGVGRLDSQGLAAVGMLPVFAAWRVGVYLLACFRKPLEWIRTPRK